MKPFKAIHCLIRNKYMFYCENNLGPIQFNRYILAINANEDISNIRITNTKKEFDKTKEEYKLMEILLQ